MKKIAFLTLLFAANLFSSNFQYLIFNKHGVALPENLHSVRFGYQYYDEKIDFYNMKEKELGSSSSKFGNIGDMDGYDLEYRYGINKRNSFFFNLKLEKIEHTATTLNNRKIEIFDKILLSDSLKYVDAVSMDVGYINNTSSSLDIKKDTYVTSLINRIRPNSGIKIIDGVFHSGRTTVTIYDNDWNKLYPYVSINDLSSSSFYLRFIASKVFKKKLMIDAYASYQKTDVNSKIDVYPKNHSFFDSIIGDLDIPNLNRKEDSYTLGFSITKRWREYLYEMNYERIKIKRDKLKLINENEILNISLSKEINKKTLLYLWGRIMNNQFNSDLPFLYNKYTETQFDKKYGYINFGFVYNFK